MTALAVWPSSPLGWVAAFVMAWGLLYVVVGILSVEADHLRAWWETRRDLHDMDEWDRWASRRGDGAGL